MPGKALLDDFSALEDPRQAWKVVYPLPEIMLLVLCGTRSILLDKQLGDRRAPPDALPRGRGGRAPRLRMERMWGECGATPRRGRAVRSPHLPRRLLGWA